MSGEAEPLLRSEESGQRNYAHDDAEFDAAKQQAHALRIRSTVWAVLGVVFIVGVVFALAAPGHLRDHGWSGQLPRDPDLAAQRLLDSAPVIVRLSGVLLAFLVAADLSRLRTVILVSFNLAIGIPLSYSCKDLPWLVRLGWRNNVSDVPLDGKMPMHVDIARLTEGKVGGFFWYVFQT
jgi:membrane dipeptidase